MRRNLQRIREGLAPTAYFIDVWSSIGPYDYWTADGKFFDRVYTRTSWGEHFAWIRDLLGDDAPQISESGHDQLIGWLDGAQTNHLRVGPPAGEGRHRWAVWDWPCADAERVPWFDAAHHDRFILHGAGYSSRYQAGLDARLHGIYSDDYTVTEVLTGHPAMVPSAFGRDVVRKYWLLQDVARALALRTIEGVEFVGDDSPSPQALPEGKGSEPDLHRQHVRWSGGGRVWVNRGQSDWQVEGVTLPQYGFLARGPTDNGPVEASITRRDGVIVETARSPEQLYVNGRQVVNAPPEILARHNPEQKPIDFGAIVTVGACRLTRDGDALVLTPLPGDRVPKFKVQLRWPALPWQVPEPTQVEHLAEDGSVLRRDPVRREGGAVVIECEPGVFAYRLVRD